MPFTVKKTKFLKQKLFLILFIPTLLLGTFLLTGLLMAITGSALSALVVVLVILVSVVPILALKSDDARRF